MGDVRPYRHGRIIFASLRSSATGKRERHPAIILDDNEEIVQPEEFDPRKSEADNYVHVIGVSTKHKRYSAPYVQLPFVARGHTITKLREDCGAIIGWYHRVVIPDDVIGFGGDVPMATMHAIVAAVRKDLAKKIGTGLGTLRDVLDELHASDE